MFEQTWDPQRHCLPDSAVPAGGWSWEHPRLGLSALTWTVRPLQGLPTLLDLVSPLLLEAWLGSCTVFTHSGDSVVTFNE